MQKRHLAYGIAVLSAWMCSVLECMAGPRSTFVNAAKASMPPDRVVYRVLPSMADPAVWRFDTANIVMFDRRGGPQVPLMVFMTGTGGKPEQAKRFLGVVANLGYRVIGLAYNDTPAVMQVCPKTNDPACSAKVRQRRIFGDPVTDAIDDAPHEAIVSRLVALLKYLDAHRPGEHWGDYLNGDAPNWKRLTVAGQSQGAGMAAYIAKQKSVDRVVLLSGPWDYYGPAHTPAPWLAWPNATAHSRWYALYHAREKMAALLAKTYPMLNIPPAHVGVADEPLPDRLLDGENPYHAYIGQYPAFAPYWQALFGKPEP